MFSIEHKGVARKERGMSTWVFSDRELTVDLGAGFSEVKAQIYPIDEMTGGVVVLAVLDLRRGAHSFTVAVIEDEM